MIHLSSSHFDKTLGHLRPKSVRRCLTEWFINHDLWMSSMVWTWKIVPNEGKASLGLRLITSTYYTLTINSNYFNRFISFSSLLRNRPAIRIWHTPWHHLTGQNHSKAISANCCARSASAQVRKTTANCTSEILMNKTSTWKPCLWVAMRMIFFLEDGN